MERRCEVGSEALGVKRWALRLCTIAAVALLGATESHCQTLVIRADTVIPVSGPAFKFGIVVVRDGKIESVGQRAVVWPGARVIHAAVAMPGLVDPHSYLGCQNETDEPVDAITPDLRACDAFDSQAPLLRKAVAAGVTAVGIAPGNGNVIAGQMSAMRLGSTPQILSGYAAQKFSVSLDAANVQRNPTSRAGAVALARAALGGARRGQSVSSSRQTALLVGEFPTRLSERTGALKLVLDGRVPAFMHAPESVDAEVALQLADEFHLKPVLLHAGESVRVADMVKSHGATVVVGPLKFEDKDRTLESPGRLARAGVKVAFCTDAPLTDPGSLRMTAHLAVKYGMPADAAIRAITLNGAEALGLGARTGSLDKGKDADLLLLSGDPLDLTSRVVAVISGGRVVYEAGKQ